MSPSAPDAALASAIATSRLGELPGPTLERVLDGARDVDVPAGMIFRGAGVPGPHVELVVTGVVRNFVAAPDGRSLTIRYVRPGALLGVVSVFATGYVMPASLQALTDARLLVLRPQSVARLAEADPAVGMAMLHELSDRVLAFVREIPASALTTVRQRLARHLMDLASERQHDRDLVAPITQQGLADAIGTVREVVVRTLRELRADGLVETGRNEIRILDPERLFAEIDEGNIGP